MNLQEKKTKDAGLNQMVLTVKATAARFGLINRQAEVILVIDISLSMTQHFSTGRVQEVVERMLAVAMNFDPDKSIRLFAFGVSVHDCGTVTADNYHECVQYTSQNNVLINGHRLALEGGTRYAPAFDAAYREAFGADWQNLNNGGSRGFLGFGKRAGEGRPRLTSPVDHPFFTLFVTDGDCSDRTDTMKLVDKGSQLPMFTQFAGFGHGFRTLDEIDNMSGRHVDNAGVFTASTLNISDQELFNGMLNEFPQWLRATANEGWYK